MKKTVLWIDDNREELLTGARILSGIDGIEPVIASSSREAMRILRDRTVHTIVTDILRRGPGGSVSSDDGYTFFREYVRREFPTLPVLFHTKNLPSSFETDDYSQYLSKWEPVSKKAIELEVRLADSVSLYEAYADWDTWNRIQPRLIEVRSKLLERIRSSNDIWQLSPDQFEELVGELLEKIGYSVLWVPGGKDGGIDIVASSESRDFLIDVKRYQTSNPVSVELVRAVYGLAEMVSPSRPDRIVHGGIITSSRFTKDARLLQQSIRTRPLLRDGNWLKTELANYAPRIRR